MAPTHSGDMSIEQLLSAMASLSLTTISWVLSSVKGVVSVLYPVQLSPGSSDIAMLVQLALQSHTSPLLHWSPPCPHPSLLSTVLCYPRLSVHLGDKAPFSPQRPKLAARELHLLGFMPLLTVSSGWGLLTSSSVTVTFTSVIKLFSVPETPSCAPCHSDF